jgi:hypothetical protein
MHGSFVAVDTSVYGRGLLLIKGVFGCVWVGKRRRRRRRGRRRRRKRDFEMISVV